jgi:hypothetical protein
VIQPGYQGDPTFGKLHWRSSSEEPAHMRRQKHLLFFAAAIKNKAQTIPVRLRSIFFYGNKAIFFIQPIHDA